MSDGKQEVINAKAQFLISTFKSLELFVRLHLQDHSSLPPLYDLLSYISPVNQKKVDALHIYQICTVYPEAFDLSRRDSDGEVVVEVGVEKIGVTERIANFEKRLHKYMADHPDEMLDIPVRKQQLFIRREFSPKKSTPGKVVKGASDKYVFKEKSVSSGKSLLERIRAKEEAAKRDGQDPQTMESNRHKLRISGKLESIYGLLYDLSPKGIATDEQTVSSFTIGNVVKTVQNSFASPISAADVEDSINEIAKILNDPRKVKMVKSGEINIVRIGTLERSEDLKLIKSLIQL